MDEIMEIKKQLVHEGNPFYEVASDIVFSMVQKIRYGYLDGHTMPEEYPEPITYDESFRIKWAWCRVMEHESGIRPVLEECRELMG